MQPDALHLKWRPANFDEMVGQDHIVKTLKNMIINNNIRSVYLMTGLHGCGKTSTARILAKAVNCLHPNPAIRPCGQCEQCLRYPNINLIEIDAATNTGIDEVRELRKLSQILPDNSKYKVYIIDEVHRFSGSAFDGLLKTIEEPPLHCLFILATTDINKVPDTIKSRCVILPFYPIDLGIIQQKLYDITLAENIQCEGGVLEIIASNSGGSLRDALKLLDQLSMGNEKITINYIKSFLGIVDPGIIKGLCQATLAGCSTIVLDIIHDITNSGSLVSEVIKQTINHLRFLLNSYIQNNNNIQHIIQTLINLIESLSNLISTARVNLQWVDFEIALLQGCRNSRLLQDSELININYLTNNWHTDKMIQNLSKFTKYSTQIIDNCIPYSIDGKIIVLKTANVPLAESLNHISKRALIELAIFQTFGYSCEIRIEC